MAMSNEELERLIQKAQITTALGGIVAPQQANEFIDMSVDQTAVLDSIRTETGITSSLELHDISLGEPVTVDAVEGAAPAEADVTVPTVVKKILKPTEKIAAFDLTFDEIRKNIEGEGFNDTLNMLFSKRMGKDLVLGAFNGDKATVGTTRLAKALRMFDGFGKLLDADASVHDFVIPANPTYSGADGVFSGMIRQLPKDYRDDRAALAFYVSQNVLDAYEDEITARQTAAADAVMFGNDAVTRYKRIAIIPVFGKPDDEIELTVRRNLAIGFGKEMTFGIDTYQRRRMVEVTITYEADVNYVRGDAVVRGKSA